MIFFRYHILALFILSVIGSSLHAQKKPIDPQELFPLMDSLMNAGRRQYLRRDMDSSLALYSQVLELTDSKKLEDKKILFYIADSYYIKQNFAKAIKFYNSFLNGNQTASIKQKSHSLHRLSICYRNLGLYKKAMESELIRLELVKSDDYIALWESYYQIGGILVAEKDYEGAFNYYEKALHIAQYIPKPKYAYTPLGAIAYTYEKMDSLTHALEWGQKALEYADSIDYEIGTIHSNQTLGAIYSKLKEPTKAHEHLALALELILQQKYSDKWTLASIYNELAVTETQMNQFASAKKHFEEAKTISTEIGAKPILKDLYFNLSLLATAEKKHELASNHLKQHIEIRDKIDDFKIKERILSDKMAYEVKKKEEEILTLRAKHKSSKTKEFYTSLLLIFVSPLLILLGIAFFMQRHTKKKLKENNKYIETQNRVLEKSNKKLEESNRRLEESNKELEQFAYVASHDMREPIRTIISFNSLLSRKYKNELGTGGMEFVNFVDNAANRLDQMLTDLLSYSRVNTQNHTREILDLNLLVASTVDSLSSKLEENNATITVEKLPKDVLANSAQMDRLFQNLITNGIKYNERDDKQIKIYSKTVSNGYHIFIQDNGIGIAPKHHTEVFEIFRRLHGVGEYEGSGIGLATCKKIVEKHEGKIWLESNEGHGTIIIIYLPFVACEPRKSL